MAGFFICGIPYSRSQVLSTSPLASQQQLGVSRRPVSDERFMGIPSRIPLLAENGSVKVKSKERPGLLPKGSGLGVDSP